MTLIVMTASEVPSHLFVLADGRPLKFIVSPLKEAKKLKPFIVAGGGQIYSKIVENGIKLAIPNTIVSTPDYIHVSYIRDCIKAGKLLTMKNYEVEPDVPVPELIHSSPNISTYRSGSVRRPFTQTETAAILKYIKDNHLQSQLNHRHVWKTMEAAGVTSHSAESMRSHYRRIVGCFDQSKPKQSITRAARQQFTEREDQAILDYLFENRLHMSVGLHSVWDRMSELQVTSHSADSMRSRFRRCLTSRLFDRLSTVLTDPTELQEAQRILLLPGSVPAIPSSNSDTKLDNTNSISQTTSPSIFAAISSSPPSPKRLCNSRPMLPSISTSNRITDQPVVDSNAASEYPLNIATSTPAGSPCRPFNHRLLPSFVRTLMQTSDLVRTPLQAYLLISMCNGSVQQAQNFLRTGQRFSSGTGDSQELCPPLWTPEDDNQLKSTNVDTVKQLIDRFGSRDVCQRMAFLTY